MTFVEMSATFIIMPRYSGDKSSTTTRADRVMVFTGNQVFFRRKLRPRFNLIGPALQLRNQPQYSWWNQFISLDNIYGYRAKTEFDGYILFFVGESNAFYNDCLPHTNTLFRSDSYLISIYLYFSLHVEKLAVLFPCINNMPLLTFIKQSTNDRV